MILVSAMGDGGGDGEQRPLAADCERSEDCKSRSEDRGQRLEDRGKRLEDRDGRTGETGGDSGDSDSDGGELRVMDEDIMVESGERHTATP